MWYLAATQMARLLWAERQARKLEYVAPVLHPQTVLDELPELDGALPRISVIVPARNEAATIGTCLAALRAQMYPDLELIVVDDRSTDQTAEIVRRHSLDDNRVRLVQGQELPAGWIGKSWALHQGARAATGDWFLFVDADTALFPGAVAGALAGALRHHAPVFSVLTGQELPTIWERALQPAVFAAIAESLPVEFVNDPRLPQFAIANGQFLFVRRDAYMAIGGHEAVKQEISEDAQFAKRAKRLGWRLWLGDGRALARTRMYARPIDLWEGWTKNLHSGIRLLPWVVPPGLIVYTLGLVGPYWALVRAAQRRSWSLAAAGVVQLVAALALRWRVDRTFGVPAVYTLTQPIGQVCFLALLTASFLKVLTGRGVTWKGRRYYASPRDALPLTPLASGPRVTLCQAKPGSG